jgi:hypothetical protein
MPHIVRPLRGVYLFALLRVVAGFAEIEIQHAWNEFLSQDCFDRGSSYPVLAPG